MDPIPAGTAGERRSGVISAMPELQAHAPSWPFRVLDLSFGKRSAIAWADAEQ
jgi:hypothetical protein